MPGQAIWSVADIDIESACVCVCVRQDLVLWPVSQSLDGLYLSLSLYFFQW